MKKFFLRLLGIALVLFGIGLYLYPAACDWVLDRQTARYIREFQKKYEAVPTGQTEGGLTEPSAEDGTKEGSPKRKKEEDPLYQRIAAYNAAIYREGQSGFKDAWSYEQAPVSIDGLADGKYGYIEIPAMDLTLPLYLGASDENMAKGAAVLGQTSIPVGGKNTNSVIAGHRGWQTGSFFKEIEAVSIGDPVYIRNPWERLCYRVESIDIISPYDSDRMRIQEGKDMVTLLTCHPYLSHGKYRYVVYCHRDKSGEDGSFPAAEAGTDPAGTGSAVTGKEIVASDGSVYESSKKLIQEEDFLRRASALAILAMVALSFLFSLIRWGKKRKERRFRL